MKRWIISSALALGITNFAGCGAVCGDGLKEADDKKNPEACDDANATAGDGCSDVCQFEVPVTDYRIDELELFDEANFDRFNNANLILASAINTSDLATALNILVKFGDTQAAATTLDFGPGVFVGEVNGLDTFDAIQPTNVNIAIVDGAYTFNAPTDIILPITTNLDTGEFAPLLAREALINGEFARKGGDGIDVTDLMGNNTLTAKLSVLDLCSINIIVAGSPVNLLDAFDDGTPSNNSSVVPPPGTVPDGTNCQPCLGIGADAGCILPENDGLDALPATGDELYNVSATFEAEGNVTIN